MALAQVSIKLMAIYFHSFEIFNIQIGEMTFCKADFIIVKSNYFQNAQKGQCFLEDFGAQKYFCEIFDVKFLSLSPCLFRTLSKNLH
jgi:hypothetical protein